MSESGFKIDKDTKFEIYRGPTLRFKKLSPDAVLPSRANDTDAGLDLVAVENAMLEPSTQKMVDTGVAVEIPVGYAGFVTPRSGMAAKHGITITNAPGVIDAGYRGPLKVILHNTGYKDLLIKKGDRIAQLLLVPVSVATPVFVDELSDAERGEGGFGSSGV